jgi:hypothetical protein
MLQLRGVALVIDDVRKGPKLLFWYPDRCLDLGDGVDVPSSAGIAASASTVGTPDAASLSSAPAARLVTMSPLRPQAHSVSPA